MLPEYKHVAFIAAIMLAFMYLSCKVHDCKTLERNIVNKNCLELEKMLDDIPDLLYYNDMEGTPIRTSPGGFGGASPSVSLHP